MHSQQICCWWWRGSGSPSMPDEGFGKVQEEQSWYLLSLCLRQSRLYIPHCPATSLFIHICSCPPLSPTNLIFIIQSTDTFHQSITSTIYYHSHHNASAIKRSPRSWARGAIDWRSIDQNSLWLHAIVRWSHNFPSKLWRLGQNNSSLMVSPRASYPSTPYVRRDPALESQRIHDFLADAPPYMRRQSDAASRRSMAQKIQDFDLAFEGRAKAPRRATR